jgi:hypothetical protein
MEVFYALPKVIIIKKRIAFVKIAEDARRCIANDTAILKDQDALL